MDIKKCDIVMLIDAREKVLFHITDTWDKVGVKYRIESKKDSMKVGDYSIEVNTGTDVISFKDKVVFERKANLNELQNNFMEDKDESGNSRIVREFIRAKEQGIKLILLIEDSKGYGKALRGQFRQDNKASKMNPRAFIGMLMAYKARYGFEIVWLDKEYSASYMYKTLYYEAREFLKKV